MSYEQEALDELNAGIATLPEEEQQQIDQLLTVMENVCAECGKTGGIAALKFALRVAVRESSQ